MNYTVNKMNEETWSIDEGGVRFFVLTGTERALMIDSGMMIHNGRDIAESLTNLPLELLNTHADIDHIGSNAQFDWGYMDPAELVNYKKSPLGGGEIRPVQDGDVLDLGGRPLKIIALHGHTPGSIAILDEKYRVLFGGDPVQDGGIFMFGPMRNMPAYIESLGALSQRKSEFDAIYPSHGSIPVSPDMIDALKAGAEKVLASELDWVPGEFHGVPLRIFDVGVARFLMDGEK